MGNSASTDAELQELQRRFSPSEVEELRHLFRSLAVQSRTGGSHVIASVFQTYYGLHGPLGSRLFDVIAKKDRDDLLLSFEEFLKAKAVADKGSEEEVEQFAFQVADILRTGSITKLEADAVVSSALMTVFGPEKAPESEDVIDAFVGSARFTGPKTDLDQHPLCPTCNSSFREDSTGSNSSRREVGPAEGQDEVGREDASGASSLSLASGSEVPSRESSMQDQEDSRRELTPADAAQLAREMASMQVGARAASGRSEGGASFHGPDESCGKLPSMTEHDFRAWGDRVPALRRFLRSLLSHPPSSSPARSAPILEWPKGVDPTASKKGKSGSSRRRFLMREELAWHLTGVLKDKEAEGPWRLAYSSSLHGLSFSTFMGKVADIPVPGALLIRDKQGAVFGGVFSQPLQRHSVFYGDMRSFLFTFLPSAAIYRPSGLNQNIQWCATAFTSDSIPNGVGFGGQIGHFGLFLDSSFDRGHSWPCVTFHSPSLSSHPYFDIDMVECWSLGQPEEEEEDAPGSKKPQLKGTILDRFKEEKALLGFAGVASASDSLSKDEPDPK